MSDDQVHAGRRLTYLIRFYGALTSMIDSARSDGREEEAEMLVRLDKHVEEILDALLPDEPEEADLKRAGEVFDTDLAHNLEDPEFREAYEKARESIEAYREHAKDPEHRESVEELFEVSSSFLGTPGEGDPMTTASRPTQPPPYETA